MSNTLPPPAPASCLVRSYASKGQKGGTLIDESVRSVEEHVELMADADGYRPEACPTCAFAVMHAHDIRLRLPRDRRHLRDRFVEIRRYACVRDECGAIWQVLPGWLARHLQRAWRTIEHAVVNAGALPASPTPEEARDERSPPPPIPPTTVRRHLARLASCASAVRQALDALGAAVSLGIAATRAELCVALVTAGRLSTSRRLAALASWLHRAERGLRLM